jgi:hypothetical protein
MRISMLAITAVLSCVASPALAQAEMPTQDSTPALTQAPASAPPAAPAQDKALASVPSRYTFNRVDDGFLRLDNKSGKVAFCSPHTVGWTCQAVPEDRAALEKEIARLQDEIARLKKEIAALRAPPPSPPAPPPPPAADQRGEITIKLPTHEDIARARTAIEDAWRRVVDMLVNFKKDMMRKG